METKECFEKVMQDFNQNRKGRSLRKYCSDEGVDYKRLSEYKRLARIQRRSIQDVYLCGENGAFPPTRDGCIHSLSMRKRG